MRQAKHSTAYDCDGSQINPQNPLHVLETLCSSQEFIYPKRNNMVQINLVKLFAFTLNFLNRCSAQEFVELKTITTTMQYQYSNLSFSRTRFAQRRVETRRNTITSISQINCVRKLSHLNLPQITRGNTTTTNA